MRHLALRVFKIGNVGIVFDQLVAIGQACSFCQLRAAIKNIFRLEIEHRFSNDVNNLKDNDN